MKDFVPYYDEALALKDLGFSEPCFATIDQTDYVHIKGTKKPPRGSMMYDTIDCPTFSQAFRFFREKYGLHHSILFNNTENKYDFIYGEKIGGSILGTSNTYEQAELECLRKLIEICKSK